MTFHIKVAMKQILDLTLTGISHPSQHHALMILKADNKLPEILPGQFVEVRVDNSPATLLRRPISINYVDKENNAIWLLVHAVGEGTTRLCNLEEGAKVNCVLPLGNGFSLPKSGEKVILVGGGVGTAPLLYLGEEVRKIGATPSFLLGGKTAGDVLQKENFRQIGELFITTEDGSEGEKGFVTNHSVLNRDDFSRIYTCGPKPMMMAVARYAKSKGIFCEASLENMMACGLGACLCCVEKTKEGNLCVCTEGPVFNVEKLNWD